MSLHSNCASNRPSFTAAFFLYVIRYMWKAYLFFFFCLVSQIVQHWALQGCIYLFQAPFDKFQYIQTTVQSTNYSAATKLPCRVWLPVKFRSSNLLQHPQIPQCKSLHVVIPILPAPSTQQSPWFPLSLSPLGWGWESLWRGRQKNPVPPPLPSQGSDHKKLFLLHTFIGP